MMRTSNQTKAFKRALACSFGAAIALLLWSCWTPIPYGSLKVAQIAAMIWLWSGALWLWSRARVSLIAAPLLFGLILFLPSRGEKVAPSLYANSLENYRGVPYIWGGENARGIDCSGLMRRAMQDALWREGWRSHSPKLWRDAIGLWWRDASALALKDSDGGRIRPLFDAPDLNSLDATKLQIGDMAVTKSGVHVLAYLRNGAWIEADPNLVNGGDKVILVKAPTKNGWFHQPVVICRWKWLDE